MHSQSIVELLAVWTPSHRTTPAIHIQQLSSLDLENQHVSILGKAIVAAGVATKQRKTLRKLEELLDELNALQHLNVHFGKVVFSDLSVVTVGGVSVTSDWALIQVDDGRVGINYIYGCLWGYHDRTKWVPRDDEGVYLSGQDVMDTFLSIAKTGRDTGSTG